MTRAIELSQLGSSLTVGDDHTTFSTTLALGLVELSSFDPPGGGSDTSTSVAIAINSGYGISGINNGYIRNLFSWTAGADIQIGQNGTSLIAGIDLKPGASGLAKVNGNRILTIADEGTGNGLDADTLDGEEGSSYLRSNTSDTATGLLDLNGGVRFVTTNAGGSGISFVDNGYQTRWDGRESITNQTVVHKFARQGYNTGNFVPYIENWYDGSNYHTIGLNSSGALQYDSNTIWHGGNDDELVKKSESNILTDNLEINSASNSKHLIITRSGALNQSVKIGLGDSQFIYDYTNDEYFSSVKYRFNNTDTEQNAGANASDRNILLGSDNVGAYISVGSDITIKENVTGEQGAIDVDYKTPNQGFANQHNVGSAFYNTFSQSGSQYQAIVKGKSTGDSQTFIGSFGILQNSGGSHNLCLHSILSDGTDSKAFTFNSAGTVLTTGNTNDYHRQLNSTSATVGPGWMSVASCTNYRKHNKIIVSDADSGDHAFIEITWMRSFADSNFTVINTGGHTNRITGVRVLEDSDVTYGTKILQVYVATSSTYTVGVYRTSSQTDWEDHTALTPVIEDTKTGYTVHGNSITQLDTYGFAHEEGIRAGEHILAGGKIEGLRVVSGYDSGVANSINTNNWFRVSGNGGIFWATHTGGWYMQDTTWIRTYNNKSIYQNAGVLRTDGTLQVGSNGSKLNVPNGGTPTIDGSTIVHEGNLESSLIAQGIAGSMGWVPGYHNASYSNVRWNFTERAVELHHATDTTIGMILRAVPVYTGKTIRATVSIKASAASTSGVYLRLAAYDGTLPNGTTHVSHNASNGPSGVVVEDTQHITNWVENNAATTTWTTYERDWTISSTSLDAITYVSLYVLNWSGLGVNSLYVRDASLVIVD